MAEIAGTVPPVLPEFGAGLAPFIAESCDDLKSPSIPHSDYRRSLYSAHSSLVICNTHSDTQSVQCDRMIMITEQASILKKSVLAYLKLLPWHLCEKSKKNLVTTY